MYPVSSLCIKGTKKMLKSMYRGFPGGPMVKNPPLPVQGTWVHPWCRKISHAVEQLSPCATTTEPSFTLLHNKSSPCIAKPMHRNSRGAATRCNQRKPSHSNKDPVQPKVNNNSNKKFDRYTLLYLKNG